MLLRESASHNAATPKHADHIVKNASANSTHSESPSKNAADASHQIRNPRCRASCCPESSAASKTGRTTKAWHSMSEQSANISLDGLLSSRSVCTLLDVPDRQLRRFVSSGQFPAPDRRLGRSLRWKCSTVQGFLDGNGSGSEKGSTAA